MASNNPSDARTRQTILQLLKRDGPRDSRTLGEALGISAMAVRQHLYALHADRLVTYEEESRGVGRPAKMWRLTPEADRFFPQAYSDLAVGLLAAVGETFGPDGVKQLLATRARHQIEAYQSQQPADASLPERLEALATARSNEGYMAGVQEGQDGSYLFVENHCPICHFAQACTGICAAELDVFQTVLGSDVVIERTEHIVSGARRCAYRVSVRES